MKAAIPRTETPLSVYRSSLAPWLALSREGQQKIVAALEISVLQGVEMPLDGRTIIVENGLNPQGNAPARHSMPGDVIRLVLPEEIAAFAAYRRTMAFIFDDRQIGSSERGQTYEAIVEAIRLTDHPNYRGAANKMEQFLLSLMVKRPAIIPLTKHKPKWPISAWMIKPSCSRFPPACISLRRKAIPI